MSSAMCGTMETGFFSDPAPCMSRSNLKITSNFFCNWSCPLQHHQSYEEEDTRRSTPTIMIAPASERRHKFQVRPLKREHARKHKHACKQVHSLLASPKLGRPCLPLAARLSKACRKHVASRQLTSTCSVFPIAEASSLRCAASSFATLS